MRLTITAFLVVCITVAAMAQSHAEDTVAGTVSGNQFQSAFLKFRYEFPKGWTYLNLDKMRAENEEASRKAAEKSLKENGPDSTTCLGEYYDHAHNEAIWELQSFDCRPSGN